MSTDSNSLNERSAILLKKLVDSYLLDGQPVGSRQLAENAGLAVSPATIRNVMSGLEKQGLIKSPHTSAGRIPTEQGLRMFVDTLLEVQPLTQPLLKQMKQQLNPDQNKDTLINHASQMVSELTHMAGVISLPKSEASILRHIEFLSLPDRRALTILVINEKEVQNRVIHLDKDYTTEQLQTAANYLNQHFAGQEVSQLRHDLLSELHRTHDDMNALMKMTIEVAEKAMPLEADNTEPYRLQGESNLVRYQNTDTNQLQQMLEMFHHKHDMLSLLDRCVQAEGVKIFIGKEVGIEGLGDCSVISAPYSVKGELLGVLGVIGPTRMNYDKVIPVVDVTARLLGEALNQ